MLPNTPGQNKDKSLMCVVLFFAFCTHTLRSPTNSARSFADIWIMVSLLVIAPILFPHPPLRSNCYYIVALPNVFIWAVCDVLWFNNPFGANYSSSVGALTPNPHGG